MDAEFINEYIERLLDEVNSLTKEKVIFRTQITLLSKKFQNLEQQYAQLEEQHRLVIHELEQKKKKTKAPTDETA